MALRAGLHWNGPEVKDRVTRAAVIGVNLTLAACLAKGRVRAPIRTGNLRGSGFIRPAVPTALGVSGSWGFSAGYAAYVELGTRYMDARPYMRPAADEEYPKLAGRIRAAL